MRHVLKLKITIPLILCIVVGVGLFYWRKSQEIHAWSRIKIEVVDQSVVMTNFYMTQYQTITEFLNSPEQRVKLAEASKTSGKKVYFDHIGPWKGTQLIYLEYTGYDSNAVVTAASNAATTVVSFYETNFPKLKASYFDVLIRN